MTVLIVGGVFQGKLDYAKKRFSLTDADIFEPLQNEAAGLGSARCVNRLHLLVRSMLEAGKCLQDIKEELLPGLTGKIVLCDDISCGIVPVDPFEGNYRETVGRLLCELARTADVVIRMQCGLAQIIKGGDL